MAAFLVSEAALFCTLIVTYLWFAGKDRVSPTPREALTLPLVLATTFCLLSSSATIHRAEQSLARADLRGFKRWWGATILLGAVFLGGTAFEWRELIVQHHLTISRNLFGTTYYTLVGFHGAHVTIGLVVLSIVLGLVAGKRVGSGHSAGVQLSAWYWHFVDAVWVAVFGVVYIAAR
jgi:cytochrome c oxidase subunit 3/cytochrome o ubiquinol oxidase subunit 3